MRASDIDPELNFDNQQTVEYQPSKPPQEKPTSEEELDRHFVDEEEVDSDDWGIVDQDE